MNRSIVILLHVIYWTLISSSGFTSWFINNYLTVETIGTLMAYTTLCRPFVFYLTYFFIFKILRNKKILLYTVIILACLITSVPLVFGLPPFSGLHIFANILPALFTGGLFRFFIDWIKKDKQQLQLSKQNLQSELALLRTQVNPHFLFNSLNNIDTLIAVNPAKASDSLLKLSDMMRYMLYEADSETVSLQQETDYLKKYIGLQQIRLTNPELLSFKNNIENPEIRIAPMLFIPFVENAFKHTTDKSIKNGISITINSTLDSVFFEIINIFDKERQLIKDKTSGIGLNNVKRRLKLLYPDRHKLEITQENNLYTVKLSLRTNAS